MHHVSSTVAYLGASKAEIETPALCLDLNSLESNVNRIAASIAAAGKLWRPHASCHKCPKIALQQVRSGAIGITCSKISEAEIFASSGIEDILITHLPVGDQRCQRVARLCHQSRPIITCDHYVQAQALSAACIQHGVQCRVLVELNVGMERTGVRPGRDAIELGKGVDRLPGLILAGIMGYAGHVRSLAGSDEAAHAIDAAANILSHTRDLYRNNGLCCDIISAGGSDLLDHALRCESLTEVQAGSLIFGEGHPEKPDSGTALSSNLSVLATVVSRPGFERGVLDIGSNTLLVDDRPPVIHDWPDATIVMQTTEHTVLQLGPSSRELRIGDRIELTVNNPEHTVPLHDEILFFRGQRLESIWPISARGKLI